MSCTDNSCGTGGWGGPLPGDPSNDLVLSAVAAFGGIDLSWIYPATNPFAVAYVEIFRSTVPDFGGTIEISKWSGDSYFDRVEPGVTYYYWIRTVSINGTTGDLAGPASARARASVEKTIIELTGLIDAGLLAQSLREPIEMIKPLDGKIVQEVLDRIAANGALSAALDQVRSGLQEAMTFVQHEIDQRIDGDSALVTQLDTIAVALGNTTALITEEQQVRAGKDEALASRIDTLYTNVGDTTSLIQQEQDARSSADEALAHSIDTMYATLNGNITAGIQSEAQIRVNADAALGQRIDTLSATFGDGNSAAIQEEARVRADADTALAGQITTVQASVDGHVSQVQQTLQSNIDGVNNKVNSIYLVKLNADGLIGGFGLYNDGVTVQAGFDVDTFWIGRTNANKMKPFIIQDDVVYINSAAINKLEVSKITSGEVDAEWRMRGLNGRLVFDNGVTMKVQGTGFGANRDLIAWFGPSMPIDQCSKTNAVNYEAIDGSAYFGGALRAGILYNAQRTTQTAPNAEVPLGPFLSNGHPKIVVVSYTYSIYAQHDGYDGRFTLQGGVNTANIVLLRSFNGGAYEQVASGTASGDYMITNETDGPDSYTINIGASFTITDTGPQGNYTYIARLSNRQVVNITHSSGSINSFLEGQSLGIVSTEA